MADSKADREREIIGELDAALAAMSASGRRADRDYGAYFLERRDAGAFERLAKLIIVIEDIFRKEDILLASVSQTTISRCYSRGGDWDGGWGCQIRVSDH